MLLPSRSSLPSLRWALAVLLVLLAAFVVPSPLCHAENPGLLLASASGEYSTALSDLPETTRREWVQQEQDLRDDFAQQALDIQEDNRTSLRDLKEDAAEARLLAQEKYREDLRKLNEEHNEDVLSLSRDLPPERYKRERKNLNEDHLDDTEELRLEKERILEDIRKDLQEDLDELTAELQQSLFDLEKDKQYALDRLENEKMEDLLRHYRQQLELEALRKIVSSRGIGPAKDQVLSEMMGYLRGKMDIEASQTDLGSSRIRISVTLRADPVTIDQAMELLGLSDGRD